MVWGPHPSNGGLRRAAAEPPGSAVGEWGEEGRPKAELSCGAEWTLGL